MGKNRFVKPGKVRLALSEGDWIDVKTSLTAGDARQVYTDVVKSMYQGERVELDPSRIGLTKLLVYIVDWSFEDDQGPVPFSESALLNLEPEVFQEIMAAVEKHEEAQDVEAAARKNGHTTERASSPISESPVSVIGGMSGSETSR